MLFWPAVSGLCPSLLTTQMFDLWQRFSCLGRALIATELAYR